MSRSKPSLSPGYQAFLAAILDEPDHAGAAAFAASILGEETGYPNEPRDEKRRWTTGDPHEDWINAVMRGGPVSPETSGDIDAARNLFMNAAMRHARAGSAGPFDDLVVKPGDVFRPQTLPFLDKPGNTYSPIPLRTGESISVGLSPFAPRKPRSFAERKATLISAPVLSTATSEPLLGDSNGDLFIPIADGSEPTKAQSGHGRAWVSSGAVTWDDFKGTPPPEERKADAGGRRKCGNRVGVPVQERDSHRYQPRKDATAARDGNPARKSRNGNE